MSGAKGITGYFADHTIRKICLSGGSVRLWKSTIAALLTGKNRTFSGQIQINNVPIQEIKESSLMDKITLVRHNSYLFKGTVEENLKWRIICVERTDGSSAQAGKSV